MENGDFRDLQAADCLFSSASNQVGHVNGVGITERNLSSRVKGSGRGNRSDRRRVCTQNRQSSTNLLEPGKVAQLRRAAGAR